MIQTKLKNCPHCESGKGILESHIEDGDLCWTIHCSNWCYRGESYIGPTAIETISEYWNHRPREAQLLRLLKEAYVNMDRFPSKIWVQEVEQILKGEAK